MPDPPATALSVGREAVDDLLSRLDRALPGRVEGFYVVGSACTGAFRPGRSDIDFVGIVAGPLDRAELMRLRTVHLGRWASSLLHDAAAHRRWPLVCNGIYVRWRDLAEPPRGVTPIAAHVAGRFRTARAAGFDVNPVTWHTLAGHGIAIRGPERTCLRIHTDVNELRRWSLANLNDYWRRWAERPPAGRALPRRAAAAGVLGTPRLHCTVATGSIVTKEAAAEYALETFDREWHPLIEEALGFWRGRAPLPAYRHRPIRLRRDASEFVGAVIDAANRLPFESPVPVRADHPMGDHGRHVERDPSRRAAVEPRRCSGED
jgi:Domain of unknown function (DUF4111)